MKLRATNHGNSHNSPQIAVAILLRWWHMRCRMKVHGLLHQVVGSATGRVPNNTV